jgi:hypothetical protein
VWVRAGGGKRRAWVWILLVCEYGQDMGMCTEGAAGRKGQGQGWVTASGSRGRGTGVVPCPGTELYLCNPEHAQDKTGCDGTNELIVNDTETNKARTTTKAWSLDPKVSRFYSNRLFAPGSRPAMVVVVVGRKEFLLSMKLMG